MYKCPIDKNNLKIINNSYVCTHCKKEYLIDDGIPVFNDKRGYWCNIDREAMREIISLSRSTGKWRDVVLDKIPKCDRHISPFYRGDIQHVFPKLNDATILDAGSNWGGLSLPISKSCKEMYCIDQTWETLKFLSVRAEQENISNINVAESSVLNLPFSNNKFDMVILNGVFEWIATDDDIVIDHVWDKKVINSKKTKHNSEAIQLKGLVEVNRVLKDDGSLFIAIENRIGLQYLAGYPDDHVNVRFVSFLPRWLASFITKIIKGHSYRTYLYSPNHMSKMLLKAGFSKYKIYSAFPHYNIISRLTPFSTFDYLNTLPLNGSAPIEKEKKIKVGLFSYFWRLIPNPLRKHLCPSYVILASKGNDLVSSLVSSLYEKSILPHNKFEIILFNNRFGDLHPVSFLIFNKDTNAVEFYCKISRSQNEEFLKQESYNLEKVYNILSDTVLAKSVPELVFSGNVNNHFCQVTKYENLVNFEPSFLRDFCKLISASTIPFLNKPSRFFYNKLNKLNFVNAKLAIDWLVIFQQKTLDNQLNTEEFIAILKKQIDKIPSSIKSNGAVSIDNISSLSLDGLFLCGLHGDFDFCNLFFKNSSPFILDFEHSSFSELPFFDLGKLIFSNLVVQYKSSNSSISLSEYSKKTGWDNYISNLIHYYCKKSNLSIELFEYLPSIVTIEQHAFNFPESRDPFDYPLYGKDIFNQMINWKLEL